MTKRENGKLMEINIGLNVKIKVVNHLEIKYHNYGELNSYYFLPTPISIFKKGRKRFSKILSEIEPSYLKIYFLLKMLLIKLLSSQAMRI
jgi:hypothetical protein